MNRTNVSSCIPVFSFSKNHKPPQKTMKKQYLPPTMTVIELHHASAILTGSKYPPGYSGELGAPEYKDILDEEW